MRVMVAVDESEESFYALQWTLDNLSNGITATNEPSMESGMLCLVHVQPPFHPAVYPLGPGGAAFYTPPAVMESVKKGQEGNSVAIVSRGAKMCSEKMIKSETLILEGDPKDMICQAIEQMHVDLLVVGSRGLGKIKRLMLQQKNSNSGQAKAVEIKEVTETESVVVPGNAFKENVPDAITLAEAAMVRRTSVLEKTKILDTILDQNQEQLRSLEAEFSKLEEAAAEVDVQIQLLITKKRSFFFKGTRLH
ncbi:hypothetical protein GH714_037184 [Hevea brasiliensis]|uniref:UspA domain-containing protein n=1 Tax=Hevea brasiliensis TaxID=3981 RepID=A0A6A6KNR7_HEVBR|nr:hypothetical protein GH714_037184 [Hevea brasiliensis]